MINKRTISFFALATLLGAAASTAFSYSLRKSLGRTVDWRSETVELRPSSNSFPSGSTVRDVLMRALDDINSGPSAFSLNTNFKSSGFGDRNGVSECYGNSSLNPPAVARTWFNGITAKINEVDVIIDTRNNWTGTTNKNGVNAYTGGARPLQNTIVHEFGHLVALMHETRYYNNMGEDWDHIHANGNRARSYLGEDTANGMVALDDSGELIVGYEFGVVHWRRTGSSGGYSTHGRTRIFDTSGNVLTNVSTGGQEPRYRVENGQTIEAEFSFENNRIDANGIKVGYYLSNDDQITTADERIGTATIDLDRDTVFTKRITMQLPADLLPLSDYYVGVIVDVDDSFNEEIEWNNATYIGIQCEDYDVWIPDNINHSDLSGRLFTGSILLDEISGTWISGWFGEFDKTQSLWIDHAQHGLFYTLPIRQNTYFAWQSALGWAYFSKGTYPYMYSYGEGSWLYYVEDSGDSRWFYHFEKGEFMQIET